MKKLLTSILCLLLLTSGFAQNDEARQHKIDSLKNVIAQAKHDSLKVMALQSWDYMLPLSEVEPSVVINNRIDSICALHINHDKNSIEERFFIKAKAESHNSLGIVFGSQSEYNLAKSNFLICLKLRQQIGDQYGIAGALSNLGNVYFQQGDYDNAIRTQMQALELTEQFDDKIEMIYPLNNIGQIYND